MTPKCLLVTCCAALALTLAPGLGHASGLVYDHNGQVVRYPVKLYFPEVAPPAPVVVVPTPVVVPAAMVVQPYPVVLPSVHLVTRDPYKTSGIVIVGAGFGGLLLHANDSSTLVPNYRLHIGLAVGTSEIAARIDLAPKGAALSLEEGVDTLSIVAPRLTFEHRFLPRSPIHPIAGLGLGAIIASPDQGETAYAMAVTARAGLEFAYPLAHSALALGLDITGHLPVARSDPFPVDLTAMLSFGAYLDFRF
ncbi:MAG: hypothetical protein JRH20_04875 [Deltaproteobacteria bacterium]|nr:hypothetical protein [Deltaproteobacteria bacterium]